MIGWVDASAGASGDMLLGALLDAGVPLAAVSDAVAAVSPEPVMLSAERVRRGGLAATRCHVAVADSTVHRGLRDVSALLASASLPTPVADMARAVFLRLAEAEAVVHGTSVEEVEFHEVGALDSITDVVGVCVGLAHLGLTGLVVSEVAVGSGRTRGAQGDLPVPVPAVAELLRGVPTYAGPGRHESCTPTGAALLAALASGHGPQPSMTVSVVGVGAGSRDPYTHANVVRLLLGEPVGTVAQDGRSAVVLEANVDDLDPRLWPDVIAALLAAGASDAWLTPILMKKGRPAHTLSVLVRAELLPAVRRTVFQQTSTIGVRESGWTKTALDRELRSVSVDGHPVAVKVARLAGEVTNVQPEYDDVAAVAAATGRPAKEVLAEAAAAARSLPPSTADGTARG